LGAPKRNRRKYDKPKDIWSSGRIEIDKKYIKDFGLKNEKELWKVQTELSKIRSNVRVLLSSTDSEKSNKVGSDIINRLTKYGIAPNGSTLDRLFDLNETSFLERRLQSITFRKGLAKSMKQARQLITHGFIAISGRKIDKPSYLVSISEEDKVGYYRPINLEPVTLHKEDAAALNNENAPEPTANTDTAEKVEGEAVVN
jgi:small subunit ribosomal protein S4